MAEAPALLTRLRPTPPPDTPAGGSGPPRPTGAVSSHRDIAPTLALVALSLAAVAGFARVFAGPGWLSPVLVTVAVSHVVSWKVRRSPLHPVAAALVDLAVVCLLTVWTVVPSSTTFGLPLGPTWHAVGNALTLARTDFPSSIAPVPTMTGFVLMAVAGSGVVAVIGDWAAFRLRSALQGAVPALALFVVCSIVGTSRGRTWCVALIVGATLLFLLVHRATIGRRGIVWFGNRSAGVTGWTISVGAGAGVAAVLAALIVTPSLPRSDGHGALGWKGVGPGSGSSDRSVPSPIVDLRTRLLEEAGTPVFTVRSPVASYWRLTSLDTFTGVQWQSTDSYLGVSRQLPGVQPATPGTRIVTQEFHIQNLASIWMPTAFNPESIAGGGQVTWDPVSASLLAARSTSNGLDYTLTSAEHLSTVSAAALSAAPSPPVDATTQRYLALPSSVPPQVRVLARSITAGASNEYQKALALQNYFVDNPAFSYSLDPPVDGYGTDALTTFLFDTRTGYCQQFAGAYAVLARAAGLPTRLAVGFTTGDSIGSNRYQVRDANAHTWPEVYFGRSLGWLPFEPTKGGGFAIPGATGYTGDTSTATGGPSGSTATTSPPVVTGGANRAQAHSVPTDPATRPITTPRPQQDATEPVLLGIGAAAGVGVLWLAFNSAARRLRWRRRRRDARGADRILVAWAEVSELLAWWHCMRRADETPTEFAARAGRRLRLVLGGHSDLALLHSLAAGASAAAYRGGAPTDAEVDAATAAAAALCQVLEAAAPRSLQMQRLVDPRLAWRSAPVEAPLSVGAPAGVAYDPL